MGLDSTQPLYDLRIEDWVQMRDTYEGQRAVKQKGFNYLPPTQGMIDDGALNFTGTGIVAYNAYKLRALYPEWVSEAVDGILGVMHREPPNIELPAELEQMRETATARGESLEMLLQRINREQLINGRVGLLGDVIDAGERAGQTYIAVYNAESIINWDAGSRALTEVQSLEMVVLDETAPERTSNFEWDVKNNYRVLSLGEIDEDEQGGVYMLGVFTDTTQFNPTAMMVPSIRGNTLDRIPFVFINSRDVVPEPDKAPLLPLSNLCLTVYRGDADYRHSLFMQGQDTLVVIGSGTEDQNIPIKVGANQRIDLPNIGADAKYIGVESTGLSEQRMALENDNGRASQMAGQLLDATSRERESGDALKVRVAARTATITQVAIVGAFGLQESLRQLAMWVGANPEEVVVSPNLDFVDDTMSGAELIDLVMARKEGAPLSIETIHKNMADRGITELTFDEEVEKVEAEREEEMQRAEERMARMGLDASTNPNGPEDDPNAPPQNDDGDNPPDDDAEE